LSSAGSCLDDEELEFLGAPWSEYWRIADDLGLDVLRLPLPEGLAPIDIELFNSHLRCLIDSYTLKGLRTLVHCRGGVGRAGLVACCWILKLGLCGWFESESYSQQSTVADPLQPLRHDVGAADKVVRGDTLQLVRNALQVIRKQRSLKAVETFEQVRFLVDYVEFLRKRDEHPTNDASDDNVVLGWEFQTDL